jgi:energy-coupling factor transporter ATP-binding protein EcfA2
MSAQHHYLLHWQKESSTTWKDKSVNRLNVRLAFASLVAAPAALVLIDIWRLHTLMHPLATFIVCEIGVFAGAFVKKVWQKLEPQWVEKSAAWVDLRTQGHIFYKKRYEQHVRNRYRSINTTGLRTLGEFEIDIGNIFVDLKINPQAPHLAHREPIVLEVGVDGLRRNIWTFLKDPQLALHSFVILGPAGSGKSTLMKHIVLALTGQRVERPINRIPILCEIERFRHYFPEGNYPNLPTLIGLVMQDLAVPAPPGWIETKFRKNIFLILVDGLDEVTDEGQRKVVADWMQQQIHAYPAVRFILTSRPYGYVSNPLTAATILEIQPFSGEQIRLFTEKWYTTTLSMRMQRPVKAIKSAALKATEAFLGRINRSRALIDMASNPLLLWMMVHVHFYRGGLPDTRVQLYSEICQELLERRERNRSVSPLLTFRHELRVLQVLALEMMMRSLRYISRADAALIVSESVRQVNPDLSPEMLLKHIEETSSVIVERTVGIYEFAHKSFQEYLAATQVADWGLVNILLERLEDKSWHETIKLFTAQSNPAPIVEACISKSPRSANVIALAVECVIENANVSPNLRAKVMSCFAGDLESPNADSRNNAAEVFLALRLHRFTPLMDLTDIDESLFTQAEYMLFAAERATRLHFHHPDHWTSHTPWIGGSHPVVGVRPSDVEALCQWLTNRFSPGDWIIRIPSTKEAKSARPLGHQYSDFGFWAKNDDGTYQIVGGTHHSDKDLSIWIRQCCLRDVERIIENDGYRNPIEYKPHPYDLLMAKKHLGSAPILIMNFSEGDVMKGKKRIEHWLNMLNKYIAVSVNNMQLNCCVLNLDLIPLPEGHPRRNWDTMQAQLNKLLSQPLMTADADLALLQSMAPMLIVTASISSVQALRSDLGDEGPPTIRRATLRSSILALAMKLLYEQGQMNDIQKLIDALVMLCLLESRIRGRSSSFEGIRLLMSYNLLK